MFFAFAFWLLVLVLVHGVGVGICGLWYTCILTGGAAAVAGWALMYIVWALDYSYGAVLIRLFYLGDADMDMDMDVVYYTRVCDTFIKENVYIHMFMLCQSCSGPICRLCLGYVVRLDIAIVLTVSEMPPHARRAARLCFL